MHRILIVDDQKSMRLLIREILKEMQLLDVDEAQDGEAALDQLSNARYDLMINDWNMPRMDGIALLKAVRANEALKAMPVIMLTGESAREQVLEAARLGVSGFVRKPFNPADLIAAIGRVFPELKQVQS